MIKIYNDFEVKISGYINYSEALMLMQKRVEDIILNNKKELIWLLNHDHIYTCGTSSKKSDILSTNNVPIINTNRGGKTTYHGPGQRIIYLVLNLNKRKRDVRKFINLLENTVICFLKNFNIESTSFEDRVGIWVTKVKNKKLYREKKIGAIGLRIKKWITYHGLSFNINPNLNYYNNIESCGLKNYSNTSLEELGVQLSQKEFDNIFIDIFNKKLRKF